MRIALRSPPVAGQRLEISLTLENRWGSVIVKAADQTLYTRRFECPDPPCHQAFSVELPIGARGRELLVEGHVLVQRKCDSVAVN